MALTFDQKIERLLSDKDSLYVQVVGSLFKINLPLKPLEGDYLTQDEKMHKFSVLRV